MTNIYKRESNWTMFQPGLYLDPNGNAHIFPDEIIAEMKRRHPQIPWDFETDYDLVVQCIVAGMREAGFREPVRFIQHEREEN